MRRMRSACIIGRPHEMRISSAVFASVCGRAPASMTGAMRARYTARSTGVMSCSTPFRKMSASGSWAAALRAGDALPAVDPLRASVAQLAEPASPAIPSSAVELAGFVAHATSTMPALLAAPAASFAVGITDARLLEAPLLPPRGAAVENTTLCTPSEPRSRISSMVSRLIPRVAVCTASDSSNSYSVGLRVPCSESSSLRYALTIAKYFLASCSLRSAVFCA